MAKIENVAFCPGCGNTALQQLVYEHEYESAGYEIDTGRRIEMGVPVTYFVAICSTCEALLLYCSFLSEIESEYFSRAELIYPKGTELHISVPNAVQRAYAEAARIRNVAPNAYAVMIRRALETVCDNRNVDKGSLFKMLEELVARGEIPATLAEMSTVLRTLGNVGAHHSSDSVTIPMTWGMDEFFRAIVEYVYVAPSKLKAFTDSLKKKSDEIAT